MSRRTPTEEPTASRRSAAGVVWTACAAPRAGWAALLERADDPIHTQTPAWMDAAVAATGGVDASRLYVSETGRQMILPLLRQGPVPALGRYASLPHGLGYAGILSDEAVSPDDTSVVAQDLQHLGGLTVRVRTGPLQPAWASLGPGGFEASEHVLHLVDLSGGFEHLWNEVFKGSLRTKIRKAEKVGVQVERDTTGARIADVYDLYEGWLLERAERRGVPAALALRLGRRAEPRRRFEAVAEHLGDDCAVWVASVDGTPVAANILLTSGRHATYWRGYSARAEAHRTRATYLLQARMIEDACARGCERYDMGESGGVASLMDFKEQFGALPQAYQELRHERVPLTWASELVASARSRVEGLIVARRSRTR